MEALKTRTLLVELPEPGRDAAPSPAFALSYSGKAITDSIAPLLLSLTYTDKTDGEADEIEVELADPVGNFRRLWYPQKGAKLLALMGWPDALLSCGEFELDEVTQAGPPTTVIMRGLAAGFGKAMRTKRSKAHENQTLRQIAERIAKEHGLTVTGDIRPVTIERATQRASRDLKFLKKIALEYGHVFSVRGKKLVFTDVYALEGARSVLTLNEEDLTSYSFTDKLSQTYTAAEVSYHNPKDRKHVRGYAKSDRTDTASDTLKIHKKAETQTQAEAQAKAALHRKNSRATELTATFPGNPLAIAGVVVRVGEWAGTVAGLYYLVTSTHRLSRSDGYGTSITAKRIGR